MIDKVVLSFDAAIADVPLGATLHVGGFVTPFTTPSYLIAALARHGATDLTVVTTYAGRGERLGRETFAAVMPWLEWPPDAWDVGLLAELRRVKKLITGNPAGARRAQVYPFERLLEAGQAEVEVIGQGSLAERIRAARAGIAAFYTPVGPGTHVAEGKEVRQFDGVPHVLERALHADFALVRAWKADRYGNLSVRGPRTFNHTMAGAARVTIAEVDAVVPLGELRPEEIHVPGVYVQRVVQRPPRRATSWAQAC